MNIRAEQKECFDTIYSLVKTAFESANHKDGDEQDYAANLRTLCGYTPNLALVAEDGGELIGHIMFTQTWIEHDNGNRTAALLLSPISVLLEYRNRGVGGALIREGLKRAKEMEFQAVFLVGDPAYYSRFGFRVAKHCNIKLSSDMPSEYADYAMGCELEPGFFSSIRGVISICWIAPFIIYHHSRLSTRLPAVIVIGKSYFPSNFGYFPLRTSQPFDLEAINAIAKEFNISPQFFVPKKAL